MSRFLLPLLILLSVTPYIGCKLARSDEERVRDLVEKYKKGSEHRTAAAEELIGMGERARKTLFEIINAPGASYEDVSVISYILLVHFPSDDTFNALESYASKMENEQERESLRFMIKMSKEKFPVKK